MWPASRDTKSPLWFGCFEIQTENVANIYLSSSHTILSRYPGQRRDMKCSNSDGHKSQFLVLPTTD